MFGYQESGERPQFRGIPLFSPEDPAMPDNSPGFGKLYPVPDFGEAQLFGLGNNLPDPNFGDEKVVTILDNKLATGTVADFGRKDGFFYLTIVAHPRGVSDSATCRIYLPMAGVVLRGEMNRSSVRSLDGRYDYNSIYWNINGDNLLFLSPCAPQFLSKLRFSFESVLRNP